MMSELRTLWSVRDLKPESHSDHKILDAIIEWLVRLPVFISEGVNWFACLSSDSWVIFDIAKLVIKGKNKSACLNAFKSWHSQSIPTST